MQCSRSSGLTANGPPMLRVLPRGTPGGARCLILGEGGSRCAPHHPPQPRWVPSVPATGGRCGCPPSQRRGAMGDLLPCCAEDLLGGPILPHCPAPAPFPPNLCPHSTKRFSGPFPLCPPTGEGGGVSSCCFPLPLGGLDPSIQTACWEAGSPWPLSAEAAGQVTPCHPPKTQGILLPLVHRAATIPLTVPWVQLITSRRACPCLSSCLLPPPRGCVLQGQPSLRAEPLGTDASHVP